LPIAVVVVDMVLVTPLDGDQKDTQQEVVVPLVATRVMVREEVMETMEATATVEPAVAE
tara:strand:+ start:198 stop:374 length:177 start_codon:yes stop_codon:yes gene_type:complete